MKGIELPINILIIVAVAVIVLIAVIAMFYPAFTSGGTVMNSESAKNAACQIMMSRNCQAATSAITISNFDADKDGLVGTDAGQLWGWAAGNPCAGPDLPLHSGCTLASTAVNTCRDPATGAENDNLGSLCKCYYSITSEPACKQLCGCS